MLSLTNASCLIHRISLEHFKLVKKDKVIIKIQCNALNAPRIVKSALRTVCALNADISITFFRMKQAQNAITGHVLKVI